MLRISRIFERWRMSRFVETYLTRTECRGALSRRILTEATPAPSLRRRGLRQFAAAAPFIAFGATFTDFTGRRCFRLLLARFVILQPCAPLHVLFPRSDPGMPIMLFHLVLVVFYDGAPE